MEIVRAIGVRAEPRHVHFAVVEAKKDELEVVAVDGIAFPSALGIPDALHHTRSLFMDVVRVYDVSRAGIRLTEWNSKNPNTLRIGLEAVLQEAMAGGPIKCYFAGVLATIAKRLDMGFDASSLKAEIQSPESSIGLPGWEKHGLEEREALITAIAAARSLP